LVKVFWQGFEPLSFGSRGWRSTILATQPD
jgi:hypothetical protein